MIFFQDHIFPFWLREAQPPNIQRLCVAHGLGANYRRQAALDFASLLPPIEPPSSEA